MLDSKKMNPTYANFVILDCRLLSSFLYFARLQIHLSRYSMLFLPENIFFLTNSQ